MRWGMRGEEGRSRGVPGAYASKSGKTRRSCSPPAPGPAGKARRHFLRPSQARCSPDGRLRAAAPPDPRSRRRSRRPRPRSRRCRPTSARVGCCSRRGCCAFAGVSPEEPSSDRVVSPASDFDGDRVVQRRGAAAPRSTSSSARKAPSRNSPRGGFLGLKRWKRDKNWMFFFQAQFLGLGGQN